MAVKAGGLKATTVELWEGVSLAAAQAERSELALAAKGQRSCVMPATAATVKKCDRVDALCHNVYTVKAHPRQAGKLNSSRRAAAQDAGRSGGA